MCIRNFKMCFPYTVSNNIFILTIRHVLSYRITLNTSLELPRVASPKVVIPKDGFQNVRSQHHRIFQYDLQGSLLYGTNINHECLLFASQFLITTKTYKILPNRKRIAGRQIGKCYLKPLHKIQNERYCF